MTHANSTDALVTKAQYDALQSQLQIQSEQISQLTEQLDWFKRQLFGAKSEKLKCMLRGRAHRPSLYLLKAKQQLAGPRRQALKPAPPATG